MVYEVSGLEFPLVLSFPHITSIHIKISTLYLKVPYVVSSSVDDQQLTPAGARLSQLFQQVCPLFS